MGAGLDFGLRWWAPAGGAYVALHFRRPDRARREALLLLPAGAGEFLAPFIWGLWRAEESPEIPCGCLRSRLVVLRLLDSVLWRSAAVGGVSGAGPSEAAAMGKAEHRQAKISFEDDRREE
ncbi:hypothetical protein NDU88_002965 [Pleurodeles waltl]|uniref:Uncharacterized protein n=1 Tax=Pleurodeles waltl TaxID=8319 RepID=A0AAV7LDZ3_PLEWA|nr:hypothetical protein NDU88_002965 [Pleurodeles waltl]